jgi:hypothetical protein
MSNTGENINFVKFEERRFSKPVPQKMGVGQVVVRECSATYVSQLKGQMRSGMRLKGMEFSVCEEGSRFTIRRDK